jgi:hypothetical protein
VAGSVRLDIKSREIAECVEMGIQEWLVAKKRPGGFGSLRKSQVGMRSGMRNIW